MKTATCLYFQGPLPRKPCAISYLSTHFPRTSAPQKNMHLVICLLFSKEIVVWNAFSYSKLSARRENENTSFLLITAGRFSTKPWLGSAGPTQPNRIPKIQHPKSKIENFAPSAGFVLWVSESRIKDQGPKSNSQIKKNKNQKSKSKAKQNQKSHPKIKVKKIQNKIPKSKIYSNNTVKSKSIDNSPKTRHKIHDDSRGN